MKHFAILLTVLFAVLTAQAYRPISDEKRAELIKSFDYVPTVQVAKLPRPNCETPQEMEYTTSYPQRTEPLDISAKAFLPAISGASLVIILPPLGGTNPLDTGIAKVLCKNNLAAVIITTNLTGLDSSSLPPVTDHDHTHRRVASAIKGAMIALKNMVNTEKVGIFGASLGGILGSVAYGVMPEISAGVFLVNGGNVPHILTYSDQSPVVKLRNARMAERGLKSFAEYEEFLNENLELDPLHFAPLIKPESVKLYLARTDKSVPTADQMQLYEALGSPSETLFYPLGHGETIFAVLGIGNQKQKIADWFLQRFTLPNPRIP